jgi:hypothetical protein
VGGVADGFGPDLERVGWPGSAGMVIRWPATSPATTSAPSGAVRVTVSEPCAFACGMAMRTAMAAATTRSAARIARRPRGELVGTDECNCRAERAYAQP